MGDIFSYELLPMIFNMTVTAGVVILVVLLARLLLKKLGAPAVVSYALWAVVLFRLLCPVSFSAPFSLLGVLDSPAVTTQSGATTIEYVPREIVHMENPTVELPIPVVDDAINAALPQGEEQLRADPLEGPMFLLTLLWLCGILVLVLYSVVSYVKLRRKLIGAVPLEGNIRLADHITSPFVMGLFRPKIYLPSELPESEREYIILHERHHIRRLDHIVKILAFAALCIHWFNPLVWLAFYLSGKDMEMSCDEAVIKKLGTDIRADYSASLLSLATGRRILAAMPLAFGEGDTGSRIKNLAKWKKPAVWITVIAVILCAVVISLCATNSGGGNNLKVRIASGGIEVTCRFDDEVDDWAVYEDIYLEGELISSKPVLINGEHPKAADTSKKLNYVFKMNMTGADGGGFASPLRFSAVDGNETITSREVDLPYETYGAFMTCAGDREAFPLKRSLGVNDEAVLFSAVLSLDEGTTVNVEDGVVGHNDTVVQYRLVTADYVREWPEQSNGNLYVDYDAGDLPQQYTSSEIYVSERCLYLTPYSSYAAMGGDSEYQYLMGDNGVHKARLDGSGGFTLTADPDWENWETFPWTDKEWKALFWTDLWSVDVDGYGKREYCCLSEEACLLRMDGALWLVEYAHNEQMGKHIYSIYELVQQNKKGTAQWEYGSPSDASTTPFASVAFPFVFAMEYDEISAVCTERPLTDLDGFEWPKGQPGIYSPETDYALTFPKGHTVYWCATDVDRVPAKQGTIHFTVHEGEQMVCAGTIYIHSWVEAETGNRTYSATLVGTGLVMEQNPDGGAIIRLR